MPETEVLTGVIERVEDMIPKSLDDIVRKNRDRFAIRFATPADLAPLGGEILLKTAVPISRWSLIALSDSALNVVSVSITGHNMAMDRTWITSSADVICGDLVQTQNTLYRLVGPQSDDPDLVHICAALHQWGLGEIMGAPHFFY